MSVLTPRPHPSGPSAVYLRTLCFVFHKDDVLLMLRQRPPDAGYWNALGGKVERGEDPLEAAVREVREEAGIDPPLEFRGVATAIVRSTGEHWVMFLFSSRVAAPAVVASAEGPLRWVGPDQIAALNVLPDIPPLLDRLRKAGDPVMAKFVYATQDTRTLESASIR